MSAASHDRRQAFVFFLPCLLSLPWVLLSAAPIDLKRTHEEGRNPEGEAASVRYHPALREMTNLGLRADFSRPINARRSRMSSGLKPDRAFGPELTPIRHEADRRPAVQQAADLILANPLCSHPRSSSRCNSID
jgi:hypothetical protein